MTEEDVTALLSRLIEGVQESKTDQRLPSDRHKAIVVTELEKVYAYWVTFVDNIPKGKPVK